MTNQFDLEDRTSRFGNNVVSFAKKIPLTPITRVLVVQFTKSGTSIGANYCEADDAESKKDFVHKIGICKKESRETKYWLRLIVNAVPELGEEAKELWREAHELTLIFSTIIRSSKETTSRDKQE